VIINNSKRQILLKGSFIGGIAIAFLFILFSPAYNLIELTTEYLFFLDIVSGFFLLIGLGMFLSDDSKINGLLFSIMFSLLILFYLVQGNIVMEGLMTGIVAGVITNTVLITKNRFDIHANIAKIVLSFFLMVTLIVLGYGFITSLGNGSGSEYVIQTSFFWGMGLLIAVIFYILLMKSIVGVKASNIFVYGPRKSGKSYFLLGLYNYVVNELGGTSDQVILSGDDKDEDNLRLASMYAKTITHELVDRTYQYHMGLYQLSAKKFFGLCPVTWTVVDYAGELHRELDKHTFGEAVDYLSEKLGMTPDLVAKKAGTLEFLSEIKVNHKDKMLDRDFIHHVIISTMYGNMLRSGKIIFLIDGQDVIEGERGEISLSKTFGQYIKTVMDVEGNRLFGILGGTKKYALVVTKTDRIINYNSKFRNFMQVHGVKSLGDIQDTSNTALELEKALYEYLQRIVVFKSLVNAINDISVYFIAVSADSDLKPGMTAVDSKEDEDMTPTKLAPWRFSEVFKFGF
jgi:hypothetical protein